MPSSPLENITARHNKAVNERKAYESLWQDCYHFALPDRMTGQQNRYDHLFDGTAPDSVEQLAASLLAELTPAWTNWFELRPGLESADMTVFEGATERLMQHFSRSNFLVEIYQCYLELVTVGTACLLFEERAPGHGCAFHFTCVPPSQLAFEENDQGLIDAVFRNRTLNRAQFMTLFPEADEPKGEEVVSILESVTPRTDGRYDYRICRQDGGHSFPLREDVYMRNPFLVFRWSRTPGALYGSSPVMKALPDIKTANKVVELILKNATIAVTGIWQADDDGVINPSNIELLPGTIIPKAVGSSGLTPLQSPGDFDVSQLILKDLRERIRHALLTDKLGQVSTPTMSATEVLERSLEMNRLLGAIYGRLQVELLSPLLHRAVLILSRRGELPDFRLDGKEVSINYLSPISRFHKDQEALTILERFDWLRRLFPEAWAHVDMPHLISGLVERLDIPADLLRPAGAAGTNLAGRQAGTDLAGGAAGADLAGGAAGADLAGRQGVGLEEGGAG